MRKKHSANFILNFFKKQKHGYGYKEQENFFISSEKKACGRWKFSVNEPLIIVFSGVSCNASIVFDVMNELVIIQWASVSGKCKCECSINNFTKQWLTLVWSPWRNLLLADANINNLTILLWDLSGTYHGIHGKKV